MNVYTHYVEALAYATKEANRYKGRVGIAIEKAKEYSRTVYRVKMVPWDPSKRFGWELRAEIVVPF